jgi:hypothetical protein
MTAPSSLLTRWGNRAACIGAPTELFAPIHSEHSRARQRRVDQAVTFCQRCPVQAECLALAKTDHLSGVWGGVMLTAGHPVERGRRKGGSHQPCGSAPGYYRHKRARETPCDPCLEAFTDHAAVLRAVSEANYPCGTLAAYRRHFRAGEAPCAACVRAAAVVRAGKPPRADKRRRTA